MNDALKQFLYKANTRGYGSTGVDEEKLPNGEHVIHFSDDDYEFKDVYYGGEPYAGQEVIFAQGGRAIWAMQYRGFVVDGEELGPIYEFLGKVLTGTEVGLPRGVDGFADGDFSYEFKMNGDLDEFSANEKILRGGKVVYAADFLGGLVDTRRED
ncbi:MAG: DUF5680 domain-containing protein [Candidatus Nomurabacteria bacterium]|jgi:hypothetical protein|nr:DUF5680 domain-containing protein [Candidatus Nomurabacteria bacterium]